MARPVALTIPARGEPGSETWIGKALEHGCGATWLTGAWYLGRSADFREGVSAFLAKRPASWIPKS